LDLEAVYGQMRPLQVPPGCSEDHPDQLRHDAGVVDVLAASMMPTGVIDSVTWRTGVGMRHVGFVEPAQVERVAQP